MIDFRRVNESGGFPVKVKWWKEGICERLGTGKTDPENKEGDGSHVGDLPVTDDVGVLFDPSGRPT